MKILDVNIEFGYKFSLLLELIDQEKPDIICAQEVQNTIEPVPLADNFQSLKTILDLGQFQHYFYSPTWGAEVFGTGIKMGNAIFSKMPLAGEQTIFINEQYTPLQTARNWVFNIRNLQICSVEINGQKIHIANHQGFLVKNTPAGGEETLPRTTKLAKALEPFKNSLIFCTDLNIIKESPGFAPIERLGLRNLTGEYNVPTTLSDAHRAPNKDSVACDFIFCSNNIQVKDFRVIDKIVSDHKALILEFEA